MTTQTTTATTTYTIGVNDDEMTIIRDIAGGVSGPIGAAPRPQALADVDAWLASLGFLRAGDWSLGTSFIGLRLEAPIVRAAQRVTADHEPAPYNA